MVSATATLEKPRNYPNGRQTTSLMTYPEMSKVIIYYIIFMGKIVKTKLGHYKPNIKFHRCIPFVCLVYRITDQPEFNKKKHKVGQGENIFPLSLSDTSLDLAKQKKALVPEMNTSAAF